MAFPPEAWPRSRLEAGPLRPAQTCLLVDPLGSLVGGAGTPSSRWTGHPGERANSPPPCARSTSRRQPATPAPLLAGPVCSWPGCRRPLPRTPPAPRCSPAGPRACNRRRSQISGMWLKIGGGEAQEAVTSSHYPEALPTPCWGRSAARSGAAVACVCGQSGPGPAWHQPPPPQAGGQKREARKNSPLEGGAD